MKLPPDFRDLLAEFASEAVEYAVIGRWGFPRAIYGLR